MTRYLIHGSCFRAPGVRCRREWDGDQVGRRARVCLFILICPYMSVSLSIYLASLFSGPTGICMTDFFQTCGISFLLDSLHWRETGKMTERDSDDTQQSFWTWLRFELQMLLLRGIGLGLLSNPDTQLTLFLSVSSSLFFQSAESPLNDDCGHSCKKSGIQSSQDVAT